MILLWNPTVLKARLIIALLVCGLSCGGAGGGSPDPAVPPSSPATTPVEGTPTPGDSPVEKTDDEVVDDRQPHAVVVPSLVDSPWGESEDTSEGRFLDPVSEVGQGARGLYLTGPYIKHVGTDRLLRHMKRSNLNALVINLKDDQGRVTYETSVELFEPSVRRFIEDPEALVSMLKAQGIYTIARIVCFRDPQLPRRHPELAVQENRPRRLGRPWISWGGGSTWLDPYNSVNHDILIDMAMEAEGFGFDEVQLDYIRFPVDEGTQFATFPAEDDRERWQVLLDMIRRMDEALAIPIGVDVFGLTAFDFGRFEALGQNLEEWTAHVEVISPMLYVNGMPGWAEGSPHRARFLVRTGVSQLRARIGPIPVVRPYLQAFRAGTDNFDVDFFEDQLRGARDGGSDGFLFWHAGSRYSKAHIAMQSAPGLTLVPFPIEERVELRRQRDGTDPATPIEEAALPTTAP